MRYINPKDSKELFEKLLSSPYFVDKSDFIGELVPFIGTEQCFICITRPRRFGKTKNARMLATFLSRGLEAKELFAKLNIANNRESMQHLGAHDVIYIDFSTQTDGEKSYGKYIDNIGGGIVEDLHQLFGNTVSTEMGPLEALATVYDKEGSRFCFIMDEWDSIFDDDDFSKDDRKKFLKFLKQLLKDKPYVEFAYMTGIMPIAKSSAGSELNMFTEYSTVDDPHFDLFFGFTEDEVKNLCEEHNKKVANPRVDYDGLKFWYDGYIAIDGTRRFNPRSVALALQDDYLKNYWTETGPGSEIYDCIRNNIDDVRDDMVKLLCGEEVEAKMYKFAASDMSLNTRDEIFSAMVVYGFLTYYNGFVSVPNHELMLKFEEVMHKKEMGYVQRFAKRSREVLAATLREDEEALADLIGEAHNQEIPLIRYSTEASLAALINLVYLDARNRYEVLQEQRGGKGIADVAFFPYDRHDSRFPPFVVELKVADNNETSEDAAIRALKQIKSRDYLAMFNDALTGEKKFEGTPLAVAISWDPKDKQHSCRIEEL